MSAALILGLYVFIILNKIASLASTNPAVSNSTLPSTNSTKTNSTSTNTTNTNTTSTNSTTTNTTNTGTINTNTTSTNTTSTNSTNTGTISTNTTSTNTTSTNSTNTGTISTNSTSTNTTNTNSTNTGTGKILRFVTDIDFSLFSNKDYGNIMNTSDIINLDINLKKELNISVNNIKNNHSDYDSNFEFINKSNNENNKSLYNIENNITNFDHYRSKKALPGVFLQATNTTTNNIGNNDTGLSTCLQELLNFYGCGEKIFQDILIIVGGIVLIVNCK